VGNASSNTKLHGLSIDCLVAGGDAAAGAVLAVLFLPAQPASPSVPSGTVPAGTVPAETSVPAETPAGTAGM